MVRITEPESGFSESFSEREIALQLVTAASDDKGAEDRVGGPKKIGVLPARPVLIDRGGEACAG